MRRREIFIELTSLLDVILIMIFVLLTQAKAQTARVIEAAEEDRVRVEQLRTELDQANASLSDAQDQADLLREERDALNRQVLTRGLVEENSRIVTVSVAPGGAIRLESEETDAVVIPYDWEDDTFASNRLRASLLEFLRSGDSEAVFIVFQYDRTAIYRTEYDMIDAVTREIKLEARQQDIPLSLLELDTRAS